MNEVDLITSSFSRFLELGGLVSRVGFSVLGTKVAALMRSEDSRVRSLAEMWTRNGDRILQTLGRLKGGVMKVGQMLSLQDSLLPDEVLAVIRYLQKEAPPVSFDSLENTLEEDLPNYRDLFDHIEETPYASASIGQVHRGKLKTGEAVAVKIQYPGIDEVIRSDLKNLKILFRLLFSGILKIDLNEIWGELNRQLFEELDYEKERRNQERFIELLKDRDDVLIPRVFPRASSRRVLTTELLPLSGETAVDPERLSPERRAHFGRILFDLFLKQLLQFRFLHSDPNFANYAFLTDGRIVIYDFGSVKVVPDELAGNYRDFCAALFENRLTDVPEIIRRIGIRHSDGRALETETVLEMIDIFRPMFTEKPYCFGSSAGPVMDQLIQLKTKYWQDSLDTVFPGDIIFVHRSIGGLFGNLNRLQACGDWGEVVRESLPRPDQTGN